ncbi:MAG: extracellular solute-binding protein [Candidatus Limnocylindrales bacterium]
MERRVLRPGRAAWVVALSIALVVAACGQASTTSSPSSAPATTPAAASPTSPGAASADPNAIPSVEAITILQPQAPWLPSFEALVASYEAQSGNEVSLAVTPFNGMVQKSLNAVQSRESEFQVLMLNTQWYGQFYSQRLVSKLTDIDPTYTLDPEIIEYGYSTRWNLDSRTSDADGDLYGLPINGNVQLFYYRTDLYEQKGLSCPQTWADVEANAQAIGAPPETYGFAVRTNPPDFDFLSYLYSHGGSLVSHDPAKDEWSVDIGNDVARTALADWVRLGRTYGPPNFADLGQPDLISLMGAGRLAQVGLVAAAAADFQDPTKSAMAGKIGACAVPGATAGQHGAIAGIWLMGIPDNLSDAQKVAALTFMKWAVGHDAETEMAHAGGIPVRRDVYEELASDPERGWWMQATLDSLDSLIVPPALTPGAQLISAASVRIRQVIAGELDPDTGLTEAAKEIHAVLTAADYKVKPLP